MIKPYLNSSLLREIFPVGHNIDEKPDKEKLRGYFIHHQTGKF